MSMLPIDSITNSLVNAVGTLIKGMGETVTYSFKSGRAPVTIRLVRLRLIEEELVGDFKQGDVRFTIDATTLPQPPAKYDTVLGADGVLYTIIDYLAVDKGINDVTLVYRPVGRG